MSNRPKEIDVHCFYTPLGPTDIYYPIGFKNPERTYNTSDVCAPRMLFNGFNTRKSILPVGVAVDQQTRKHQSTKRRKLRHVMIFDVFVINNESVRLFLVAKCIRVYFTSGLVEVCLFEFSELRHSFGRFFFLTENSLPLLV